MIIFGKLVKLVFLFSLLLIMATPAVAQQFGKPVTLKQETKISEIFDNPDVYNGKRVMVRGTVVDVCPNRGCYIMIASDRRFQSIQFKVEDGVIIFPASLKGRNIIAEGIVTKLDPTKTEEHRHSANDAAKHNESHEMPSVAVMINGLGAAVQ